MITLFKLLFYMAVMKIDMWYAGVINRTLDFWDSRRKDLLRDIKDDKISTDEKLKKIDRCIIVINAHKTVSGHAVKFGEKMTKHYENFKKICDKVIDE